MGKRKHERPSRILRRLGIRFWFDQIDNDHAASSAAHWSTLRTLDTYPPISLGSPVVGLVAIDTVVFVHANLAPLLVHMKMQYSDCVIHVNLWNTEIPIVTVTPPSPCRLFEYVCKYIYGCQCPRCLHSNGLDDIHGYMSGCENAQQQVHGT